MGRTRSRQVPDGADSVAVKDDSMETSLIALQEFARARHFGCRVDPGRSWVWITEEIIDRSLASAPQQVKLWNLAGTEFWDLSGDHVHFTPGSAAIKMVEHDSGRIRPSTVDDMLRYVRLVGQVQLGRHPVNAAVERSQAHFVFAMLRPGTLEADRLARNVRQFAPVYFRAYLSCNRYEHLARSLLRNAFWHLSNILTNPCLRQLGLRMGL